MRWLIAAALVLGSSAARPEPVRLEGRFGCATVDTDRPALSELRLRAPDGSLEPRSVLSPPDVPWLRDAPAWATQAGTYAMDASGKRWESRLGGPARVERRGAALRMTGVRLADGSDALPVAEETWTLAPAGDELLWTVERRWLRACDVRLAGTPALYFTNRPWRPDPPAVVPNSVATTFWIDPALLRGAFEPLLRPGGWGNIYKLSRNNSAVVAKRDTWAVLKLWTNWQARSDLRLRVRGGWLVRRGHFGWMSEAGAVTHLAQRVQRRAGEVERVTLAIAPSPAARTGYQLVVRTPEPGLADALARFYGGLLNGGVVNDQTNYDFGNETDGWYYAGSAWMQGMALLAGSPAPGRLAERPFDVARAFRRHLSQVIGTMLPDGRTRFGYNWTAEFVDDNLHTVIGAHAYLMRTGDLAWVRQNLPAMERMLAYFLARRDSDGLYDLGLSGHWYYDAMPTSGVNAYHNAFLFLACRCLAEMERAAGRMSAARRYDEAADRVKSAFDRRFWHPEAAGGPRYCDWITPAGEKVSYAADLCQFAPIALGLARPEHARLALATLDRRIAELRRNHGYVGLASLSAYWPVPDHINALAWQRTYPTYMNGGSFLAQTYWEVLARARAGDPDGAAERLRTFARHAARSGLIGNNWFTQRGEVGPGAADEPYLSDMVVVPAALVQGLIGVQHTWEGLVVRPRLPRGWRSASAEVVHRGIRYRVVVRDGRATVTPLGRVLSPEPLLTWEARAAYPAAWQMWVARDPASGAGWSASPSLDLGGGERITLRRRLLRSAVLGVWPLDDLAPPYRDASERGNDARPAGASTPSRTVGPAGAGSALAFDGAAWLQLADASAFTFGPRDSFTVRCWFRTSSLANQVCVARQGLFSLGVKEGRLAGWVMQDPSTFVEARGGAFVADGRWRHAALVVDRAAQKIALYLDGQLDGGAQSRNPLPIAHVGAATGAGTLCLGGFGGAFGLEGGLAEASIVRGALAATDLMAPGPRVPASAPLFEKSGEYVSAPAEWGAPARLVALRVEATLRGGSVQAVVETSDDGFRSVRERRPVTVRPGERTYALNALRRPARCARVRFLLTRSLAAPPEVRGFSLTARPLGLDATRKARR